MGETVPATTKIRRNNFMIKFINVNFEIKHSTKAGGGRNVPSVMFRCVRKIAQVTNSFVTLDSFTISQPSWIWERKTAVKFMAVRKYSWNTRASLFSPKMSRTETGHADPQIKDTYTGLHTNLLSAQWPRVPLEVDGTQNGRERWKWMCTHYHRVENRWFC